MCLARAGCGGRVVGWWRAPKTSGIGRPSTRRSRVSASLSIHFIFLNQLPPVRIKQAVHTLNPNLKRPGVRWEKLPPSLSCLSSRRPLSSSLWLLVTQPPPPWVVTEELWAPWATQVGEEDHRGCWGYSPLSRRRKKCKADGPRASPCLHSAARPSSSPEPQADDPACPGHRRSLNGIETWQCPRARSLSSCLTVLAFPGFISFLGNPSPRPVSSISYTVVIHTGVCYCIWPSQQPWEVVHRGFPYFKNFKKSNNPPNTQQELRGRDRQLSQVLQAPRPLCKAALPAADGPRLRGGGGRARLSAFRCQCDGREPDSAPLHEPALWLDIPVRSVLSASPGFFCIPHISRPRLHLLVMLTSVALSGSRPGVLRQFLECTSHS